MKLNEAPEKIYVADTTFPDYVDFDGSPINTKRIDDHDIEYARTDAFIEKACDWLRNCLDNGLWVANDVGETEKEAIIEHFKEAMKL